MTEPEELVGVCFLLLTSIRGRICVYTVMELKPKPAIFKEVGMIGPPFETAQECDKGVNGTLLRLVAEETTIPMEMITICETIPERFKLFPHRPDIFTHYAYGIFRGDPSIAKNPPDDDISFAGWIPFFDLKEKFLRVETPRILKHFTDSGYYAKVLNML